MFINYNNIVLLVVINFIVRVSPSAILSFNIYEVDYCDTILAVRRIGRLNIKTEMSESNVFAFMLRPISTSQSERALQSQTFLFLC